ncbi:MAG TPA: hypothetical protein VNN73_14535 [Blastocatellia bacterium]|nr:hypothetical protein [Blastocatellia bacterium]
MNNEEISLDRYIAAVWRAKWFIIAGVIIAAGITAFLAYRQPALHRASAQIKIGRVWDKPLEDPYITERIINNTAFLKDVAAKIGANPNQLKRSIHAQTIVAGPRRTRYPLLVGITATAERAEDAESYAKAVTDEVIAMHEKLFDDAMKPHIEEQQRLEQRYNELAAQGAAAREALLKVEDDLNKVKANNTDTPANGTERTRLITPIAREGAEKPGILRSTATAALIAAIVLTLAAALASHIRPAGKRAAAGNQT